MLIKFKNKTLHYYKYEDTIIIDRAELCNIIDPNHATSLTQKMSLCLEQPAEQVSINKPDFESIEGLAEDVTNQFRSRITFVTIAGLQRLLEKKAPFAKRKLDNEAAKWLSELFGCSVKLDAAEVVQEVNNTHEEIACVNQPMPSNVINFNDLVSEVHIDPPVIYNTTGSPKIINDAVNTIVEYILSPDVVKAVRLKAVNENKLEDDVVEELLRSNIEPKYFNL